MSSGWRQLTVAVTIVVIGVLLTTAPAFGGSYSVRHVMRRPGRSSAV